MVRGTIWVEDAARGTRRPDWREFAGTFGWPDGGRLPPPPSGREWQGAQSGQGTIELGFPRPALWQMQCEAARRAGDPSGQGEEPPPEGLGGHHLLAQTDASMRLRRLLCWRMVMEKRTSILRQTDTTP